MPDINTQIAEYKLRSLIQTGKTSQVFEVVEPRSGRHFAMKILLPEYASSAEDRAMLFHEAEIGTKMRHENVINILKVSKSETTPHFIMEFFPSGSLRTRMMSKDPRDKEFIKNHAKKIFKQAATGLAYMNASGVVHCDVKADNILVNALAQTKIIDFAISRYIKTGFFAKLFNRPGKRQGTLSYMSPEQIRREPLDGQSDIYSFGATVYEITAGRRPLNGPTPDDLLSKHLMEKPTTPQSFNPDITDEFAALVLKMLEKKKQDRPANFHEILMELKKIKIYKSFSEEDEELID